MSESRWRTKGWSGEDQASRESTVNQRLERFTLVSHTA